ncbi:SGNH/GDSL hydrolase family protein [Streptomyces sp. W1SF4]|uniref:SGNH/GDSL hydrolase family protein n=1 Tax=Streptomyces sp. W1SF4 TaxID=2305220 RepID=UPI000F7022D8|nr:SGNH/GDSL hydrolase family protein [Streptomyces sp. W1SF4]AZM92789.1 SGNH/GDSL hydrolase family protein [Streptomyces sp. W1SF4]
MTHTAPDPAERMLRFHQPERVLRHLGPTPDEGALAALFGLDRTGYHTRLAGFEQRNRSAATALAADPGATALRAGLPFRPGQHVVAVGESTTADRLSWFEILRHLLPEGVRCTNAAVSGSTTTQALANLPQLAFHQPDWVLCMLGANDAQRLDGVPLVAPAETHRTLLALRDVAVRRTGARWIWLTPPGVDPGRVAQYVHFQRAGLTWAGTDLDTVAEFLLAQPETTIDTRAAAQGHLEEDGLHLTPAGQQRIAATVLEVLGAPPDREENTA